MPNHVSFRSFSISKPEAEIGGFVFKNQTRDPNSKKNQVEREQDEPLYFCHDLSKLSE